MNTFNKKEIEKKIVTAKKYLEGNNPPDFAAEDYEVNYKGRMRLNDLSSLAKKQMALEDWT